MLRTFKNLTETTGRDPVCSSFLFYHEETLTTTATAVRDVRTQYISRNLPYNMWNFSYWNLHKHYGTVGRPEGSANYRDFATFSMMECGVLWGLAEFHKVRRSATGLSVGAPRMCVWHFQTGVSMDGLKMALGSQWTVSKWLWGSQWYRSPEISIHYVELLILKLPQTLWNCRDGLWFSGGLWVGRVL